MTKQYDIQPASVRKNKRSYPAVRVSIPCAEGGSPYVHRIYSAHISLDTGAEARRKAKEMLSSGGFDVEECVAATKEYWGLQ